jgi:hypothetical protein
MGDQIIQGWKKQKKGQSRLSFGLHYYNLPHKSFASCLDSDACSTISPNSGEMVFSFAVLFL